MVDSQNLSGDVYVALNRDADGVAARALFEREALPAMVGAGVEQRGDGFRAG